MEKRTGNKKASSAPMLKSLPPMKEAFEQHVKRAHYQVCLWKGALEQNPPSLDATMFGWQRNDASKTCNACRMLIGSETLRTKNFTSQGLL